MSRQSQVERSSAASPRPGGGLGRIAVFSHAHPSISRGGAEIAAYTLFMGLRALGLDALFIAACGERDRDRIVLGSDAERIVFHQPQLYDHFYQRGSPDLASQLQVILDAEEIGLVNFHHFMNVGVGAMHAASAPAGGSLTKVVTLHEFLPICHHHGQMVTRPARLLCERASVEACMGCFPEISPQKFMQRRKGFMDAFETVDGFVSPSAFLADRFVEWGLPADRIAVIENGLQDLKRVTATEHRDSDGPWVMGFFGQINPFKGVDTLLEAVQLLAERPDLAQRIRIRIHGNIVGQKSEFVEHFSGLVEKYPFLSYAGPYQHDSVNRLMSRCDYVLVPSNWWENSPIVIQEAYAAGRPVICSGIGGMAEKVIDGVSGLHFRVGDAADLLAKLALAADPETAERLHRGIPPVHDTRAMAMEYLAAFERFAASPGVATPTGSVLIA